MRIIARFSDQIVAQTSINEVGGTLLNVLPIIHTIIANIPDSRFDELKTMPGIIAVSFDQEIRLID